MVADGRARHAAEQASRIRDQRSHPVAERVRQQVDRAQGDRLQVDPPAPVLAHLAQHLPASLGIVRIGIDMCKSGIRGDTVRIGAAQAEIHAPAQIRRGPVGPVGGGGGEAGVVECAVRARAALNRVPLVEMGMDVDQSRPDLPAADVDAGKRPVIARGARRFDAREHAVFDQQVRLHHAFRVGRRRQLCPRAEQARGHRARIAEPIAAHGRPGNVSKPDRHLWLEGGGAEGHALKQVEANGMPMMRRKPGRISALRCGGDTERAHDPEWQAGTVLQ